MNKYFKFLAVAMACAIISNPANDASAKEPVLAAKSDAPEGMKISSEAVRLKLANFTVQWRMYTAVGHPSAYFADWNLVGCVLQATEIKPVGSSFKDIFGETWYDVKQGTGANRLTLSPEMQKILSQSKVAPAEKVALGRWAITSLLLISQPVTKPGKFVQYAFSAQCYVPAASGGNGGILTLGRKDFHLSFPLTGVAMESTTASGDLATEKYITPYSIIYKDHGSGFEDMKVAAESKPSPWTYGRSATFNVSGWDLDPPSSDSSGPLGVRDAWDRAFENSAKYVRETSGKTLPLGFGRTHTYTTGTTPTGETVKLVAEPFFTTIVGKDKKGVTALLHQVADMFANEKAWDHPMDLYFHASPSPDDRIPGGSTRVIGLSGNMAFGDVPVGSSKTSFLKIKNTGNSALRIDSIRYPLGFSGAWSGKIAPGGSKTIAVKFKPGSAQSHSGKITVKSNKTAGANTLAISGRGAGSKRIIELSARNLNFGSVEIGSKGEGELIIANVGNSPLSVSGINYPAGFSGKFSGSIDAGDSVAVAVTFSPTVEGDYSGDLSVDSDKTGGENEFLLLGFGISPVKLLDETFGSSGSAAMSFSGIGHDDVGDVAVQSDGKIVVVGKSYNGTDCFAVARFNPDGTPDTSFNGTGKVTTDVGSFTRGHCVALQNDGKILVAGQSNENFALVRYMPDGGLDSTFNGTGKLVSAVGSEMSGIWDVVLQRDGKIIAGGHAVTGGATGFALARFNSNGTLDTTFNGTGKVITIAGSDTSVIRSLALQADGRIVAAGIGGSNNFMTVRYNSDGSLDTGFNGTGKLMDPVNGSASGVAVQGDGRILVVGVAYDGSKNGLALVRYNANGSRDGTFNGTGMVISPAGCDGRSVALQADGKIVVAGDSFLNVVNNDFAVARYNPDGSLDSTFNRTGWAAIDISGGDDLGAGVALQNDGKIVVAGISPYGFTVARCESGLEFSPVAWGYNAKGALGDNSTITAHTPAGVTTTGVLSGKTVVSSAAGYDHSLFLGADGTLAATGGNTDGQLGNGGMADSSVPVAVTTSGVLAGRRVIAVTAGDNHSLALCSDGRLVSWGDNSFGQLGDSSTTDRSTPVLVTASGALSGRRAVAITAGRNFSMALCADGAVVAWGENTSGQLGNNSTSNSAVPVLVVASGALSGKKVIAIEAGRYHGLALCSDGTVAAWGYNNDGQLGNNSTSASSVPVAVTTTGFLSGRKVIAISGGGYHSIALCADGTLVAWGYNGDGELGNNSTTRSLIPIAVNMAGALSGRKVVGIGAGAYHSLALCSDGRLAVWGYNSDGELGDGGTAAVFAPTYVYTGGGLSGGKVIAVAAGSYHTVAIKVSASP